MLKMSRAIVQSQIWRTCQSSLRGLSTDRSPHIWKQIIFFQNSSPAFVPGTLRRQPYWKYCRTFYPTTDQGSIGLLGLLDMSAAFDTVDHEILLLRLESTFGISETALAWLRSFLSGRTQQVVFNGGQSLLNTVTTGVPQGSVLGPLLFLLYTADIPLIAGQFGLGVHCYADDGQLYIFDRAGHSETGLYPRSRSASTRLTNGCLQTDSNWILTRLSLSGLARFSSFRRSGLIPFNLEATMSSSKLPLATWEWR